MLPSRCDFSNEICFADAGINITAVDVVLEEEFLGDQLWLASEEAKLWQG